jgi:hypothetical protein
VLGLGAGASAEEIKAAYRDLAKVWHPDRFSHDPRLQQKAQEQLKEINEAYGRLVSGDFARPNARPRHDSYTEHASRPPRAEHTPPRPTAPDAARDGRRETRPAATADERVATRPRRGAYRIAIAAPALVFCATFAFVTPRLLSTSRAPEPSGEAAVAAPARDEPASRPADSVNETAAASDARTRQKDQTAARQPLTEAAGSPASAAAPQPVRAMPTVTVSIDPTTGLRARPSCPHKTAMTFPAGAEPSAYCDAAHAEPQRATADEARAKGRDESRLKSFAGRVTSPARKLFGGGDSSDKKPAREGNAPPRN